MSPAGLLPSRGPSHSTPDPGPSPAPPIPFPPPILFTSWSLSLQQSPYSPPPVDAVARQPKPRPSQLGGGGAASREGRQPKPGPGERGRALRGPEAAAAPAGRRLQLSQPRCALSILGRPKHTAPHGGLCAQRLPGRSSAAGSEDRGAATKLSSGGLFPLRGPPYSAGVHRPEVGQNTRPLTSSRARSGPLKVRLNFTLFCNQFTSQFIP